MTGSVLAWARSPLVVCCAVFVSLTLPLSLLLGAHSEETAALSPVSIERLSPEDIAETDPNAPGFFSSSGLPVWGWVNQRGDYAPIMIDGHVGAVGFYPARFCARIGGIRGARLLSLALGLLTVVLLTHLTVRIAGQRAGLWAGVFAATSAHFVVVFMGARADEQLDSLCHVAALLALCRFADRPRTRWFLLAAFLFGLALASKNTALWTLLAIGVGAVAFRFVPTARWWQWLAASLVFSLPLLPQLAFVTFAPADAFSSRLDMVSAPWEGFAPDRLWFSLSHLQLSLGHVGSYLGAYIRGAEPGRGLGLWVGAFLVAALFVFISSAFANTRPRNVRAFAAGFGCLLLIYFALYYQGMSLFWLLAPWFPIAFALLFSALYNTVAQSATRPWARVLLFGCAGLVVANNLVEIGRLHSAVASPGTSMFDRSSQVRAAAFLQDHGINKVVSTTYGIDGVFEVQTAGRLRARSVFPYFHAVSRGDRDDYTAAWRAALQRLGPGRHVIVLSPNPSPLDVSPCEHGEYIAEQLAPAVVAAGGRSETLATFEAAGRPVLEIVEVNLLAQDR